MSACKKCHVQLGIMIEDECGVWCIACHPTALGSGLKQWEMLDKLKNFDFKNVRERIYE